MATLASWTASSEALGWADKVHVKQLLDPHSFCYQYGSAARNKKQHACESSVHPMLLATSAAKDPFCLSLPTHITVM